jgi:hypothetical protein
VRRRSTTTVAASPSNDGKSEPIYQ